MNKRTLLSLFMCLLISVSLYGCSSPSTVNGINKDIYNKGIEYAEALYSIKDDYNNYNKFDNDEVYKFVDQEVAGNENKDFVELIGRLYVLNSVYKAAHVVKSDQDMQEAVNKMDEVVKELKSKYKVEF